MSAPDANAPDTAKTDTPAPSPPRRRLNFGPLESLRLPRIHLRRGVKNANQIHKDSLTPLDRVALAVTDKVGSMGFFLLIFGWTLCWCGYNILATEVSALHLHPFDPFPAFVAYLLISNVIQILLMPLIMVGQNVQNRHAEIRSELDFEVNQKAEREVTVILRHLEHNTDLLLKLMQHLKYEISDAEREELRKEIEAVGEICAPSPAAVPA